MFETLKIIARQGRQYIPDVSKPVLPDIFRGRPVISDEPVNESDLVACCPTAAISARPLRIDLGKCLFCGECASLFPEKVRFTNDYKLATNVRGRLVVQEGDHEAITVNQDLIRSEIREFFGGSLKLRQISAAGDNSDELELNACGNVNFDMGRFGIDFLASPRHCDGIVITGPISENMAEATQICYDAVPAPKIVILAGTAAISGGIFAGSPALDRRFLDKCDIDLYVPGNPVHPLTFVNGILSLIRGKR
jgi:Ni,Fe-hydrogenase III small subunit